MKAHHLFATFALAITATTAACVDSTESPPVTTDPAEAPPQQFCQPNYWASAPVPNPSVFNNQLPAQDWGPKQIWLIVATNAQATTFNMYQLDPGQGKVTWWAPISDQQRPYATYLASLRLGTQASIRNPPPPPYPPGDDWVHADLIMNLGMHITGAWK